MVKNDWCIILQAMAVNSVTRQKNYPIFLVVVEGNILSESHLPSCVYREESRHRIFILQIERKISKIKLKLKKKNITRGNFIVCLSAHLQTHNKVKPV